MKALINKIVLWWRAVIKYRAGMSALFKGLWDGFWYFLGGYLLAFIIFLFFPSRVAISTAAWIAACIAGGIFVFVFLYVIIVEENIFNVKRKKSKNKNTDDVIKLSDLTTNVVSGATEVIYESQEAQFDKDTIVKKELKKEAATTKKPHTHSQVQSNKKEEVAHKVDPRSSGHKAKINDSDQDPKNDYIEETLEV